MPKAQAVAVSFDKDRQIWECAAHEDSRPVLTGVYVDPKGYLVAADGFCLAGVPCKITHAKGFPGAIIPWRHLSAAAKSLALGATGGAGKV